MIKVLGLRIQKILSLIGYYRNLLGTDFNRWRDASTELSAAIQHKVPQDMREGLVLPVTESEIWNAMKSIHRDKAPGPDGFNSDFRSA